MTLDSKISNDLKRHVKSLADMDDEENLTINNDQNIRILSTSSEQSTCNEKEKLLECESIGCSYHLFSFPLLSPITIIENLAFSAPSRGDLEQVGEEKMNDNSDIGSMLGSAKILESCVCNSSTSWEAWSAEYSEIMASGIDYRDDCNAERNESICAGANCLSETGRTSCDTASRNKSVHSATQNRAGNLRARRDKLKNLHDALARPQSAKLAGSHRLGNKASIDKSWRWISQSFDDEKLCDSKVQASLKSKIRNGINENENIASSISIFCNATAGPCVDGEKSNNSFTANECIDDEEQLFYDSDPGESNASVSNFKLQSNSTHKLTCMDGSEKKSHSYTEDEAYEQSQSNLRVARMATSSSSNLDIYDSCMMSKIREFMDNRMHLLWHPVPEQQNKSSTPVPVVAWIELGKILRSDLIHPKFMWQAQSSRFTSSGKSHRAKMSHESVRSIDLLDILRVLKVEKIDRDLFPFVRPNNCFVIGSSNCTNLFEASSQNGDCEELVHVFKLMVARLGSRIITQDPAVFEEFFSNLSDIPGKSPHWTRETTNE